jgi:succinate-acetate transporter protein
MATQVDSAVEAGAGANPAPLGYAALALTTALFGTFNAGHFGTPSLVFAGMALFYGGLAQGVAAILAYRNRDTFSLTLFGSFGAFWLGLGILDLATSLGHVASSPFNGSDVTWLWFFWAIVATYLWLASLRITGAVMLVVLLLAAMFWLLWIGQLVGNKPGAGLTAVGGWLGWAAAFFAAYTSFAELINRTFGRIVLPEFPAGQMHPMAR